MNSAPSSSQDDRLELVSGSGRLVPARGRRSLFRPTCGRRLATSNIQKSEKRSIGRRMSRAFARYSIVVFDRYRRDLGLAVLRRRSNGDGQDGGSVAGLVVARLDGKAASRRSGVHGGGCKFSSVGAA